MPPMSDTALPVRTMRRLRLPTRRQGLKLLHWSMVPLFVWFVIATPEFVRGLWGSRGNAINSQIALVFVTLCLIWTVDVAFRGMAGRPGPKLSPRLKRFHWWLHRIIVAGIAMIPLGGFLIGLTSDRLLKAGGILPIAPPMDWERANEIIGKVHIYQFYTLCGIVVIHAGFHIWRHVKLRDNALRIMVPKALHRWL